MAPQTALSATRRSKGCGRKSFAEVCTGALDLGLDGKLAAEAENAAPKLLALLVVHRLVGKLAHELFEALLGRNLRARLPYKRCVPSERPCVGRVPGCTNTAGLFPFRHPKHKAAACFCPNIALKYSIY